MNEASSVEELTAADLTQRLNAMRRRMEALEAENQELRDAVAELQQTHETRDAVIQRHTERLDDLDRRTDLLQLVEQTDDMTGEQRSAALLQHLKRKAENRADDEPSRAAVDHGEAEEALHYPDVERTTIYRDMERCERLVGDDNVCWYDDGELVLNLDVDEATQPVTAVTEVENL